jgi:hypothetical protein
MDAVFLELQIQIRVGETTGTPMLLGNDFARLRLELAADLAAPRAVFEGLSQPVRQTKIFFFIAPSMIKIKPMWRQERGHVLTCNILQRRFIFRGQTRTARSSRLQTASSPR